MREQRNYGIDLLRIIAMYMVLILHILGRGGVLESAKVLSVQYETAYFLETAAYCAVNCYALISGYVGINAAYKYSNLCILWLRVVFYTVGITILYAVLVPSSVHKTTLIKNFFPVMTRQYWYFTAYVCLFLFIPLLNKAIHSMNRTQALTVSIGLFVVFSILPTIFGDKFGTNNGYSGLWLIILYIMGACIKKWHLFESLTTIKAFAGYILMVIISWGFKFAMEASAAFLGENSVFGSYAAKCSNRLIEYISPTILMSGIFLLLLFSKITLNSFLKKCVPILAPLAFSVYLINTNFFVWQYIMPSRYVDYAEFPAPLLIAAVLGSALFIYISCSAIDMIRVCIFKIFRIKERLDKLEKKHIGNLWE